MFWKFERRERRGRKKNLTVSEESTDFSSLSDFDKTYLFPSLTRWFSPFFPSPSRAAMTPTTTPRRPAALLLLPLLVLALSSLLPSVGRGRQVHHLLRKNAGTRRSATRRASRPGPRPATPSFTSEWRSRRRVLRSAAEEGQKGSWQATGRGEQKLAIPREAFTRRRNPTRWVGVSSSHDEASLLFLFSFLSLFLSSQPLVSLPPPPPLPPTSKLKQHLQALHEGLVRRRPQEQLAPSPGLLRPPRRLGFLDGRRDLQRRLQERAPGGLCPGGHHPRLGLRLREHLQPRRRRVLLHRL